MARPEEERYTDLLRQLADPGVIEPATLADALREIERQHSMGHVTAWQLQQARDAYAATVKRDPRQGAPRSPETRADERE